VAKTFDLDVDRSVVEAVQKVAEGRGIPMAQLALAWVLSKPVVSAPIVGATKPHHLADAVAALDVALTDDEIRDARRALHATSAVLVLAPPRLGLVADELTRCGTAGAWMLSIRVDSRSIPELVRALARGAVAQKP